MKQSIWWRTLRAKDVWEGESLLLESSRFPRYHRWRGAREGKREAGIVWQNSVFDVTWRREKNDGIARNDWRRRRRRLLRRLTVKPKSKNARRSISSKLSRTFFGAKCSEGSPLYTECLRSTLFRSQIVQQFGFHEKKTPWYFLLIKYIFYIALCIYISYL